jgi:hypothetical protein
MKIHRSVYKPAEGLENTITLQTINHPFQQTERHSGDGAIY